MAKSFWRRHPHSGEALIAYANTMRRATPRAEVLALIEQAVAIDPHNPIARMTLADEYLALSRLDEAEGHYDAVLAERANNVRALAGRGHVARRRAQRAAALSWFAAAAAADGSNAEVRLEYARELMEAERTR